MNKMNQSGKVTRVSEMEKVDLLESQKAMSTRRWKTFSRIADEF